MSVLSKFSEVWVWDEVSFIRAWEADIFGDQRVELVEGEVWPVAIGSWHGQVVTNVIRLLPDDGWRVTTETLPAAGSMPDPDAWVRPRGAQPVSLLGDTKRIARWNPGDVALVVEVADATLIADTEIKNVVYGRAGFATYWVIHREGVEVFTDRYERGYRQHEHVDPTSSLTLPYGAGTTVAVADLLDAE